MKKILALVLAVIMVASLAACGGGAASSSAAPKPAPAPSSAAPAPSSAAPKPASSAASKPDLKNPEYTPEQLAVAEKFAAMSDKFQALADKINGNEQLLAVEELVDTMNTMIDAVNEDDALFADPKSLTPEVLKNLEEDIKIGNNFVKEIEAMIKNYDGKKTVTIPVEVVNNTGVEIHGLAMSPAKDTEWGGNLLTEPLADGESGVSNMTFTEDTLVWDLMAADAEGTTLTFAGIDFSAAPTTGAKLVLSATEGGYLASFAQ